MKSQWTERHSASRETTSQTASVSCSSHTFHRTTPKISVHTENRETKRNTERSRAPDAVVFYNDDLWRTQVCTRNRRFDFLCDCVVVCCCCCRHMQCALWQWRRFVKLQMSFRASSSSSSYWNILLSDRLLPRQCLLTVDWFYWIKMLLNIFIVIKRETLNVLTLQSNIS